MMEQGQHIAEQAFRAFVDHSPLSIAMLDLELKVLNTSPGWRRQQQSESPTEAALSQDKALASLIEKALNGEPGHIPKCSWLNIKGGTHWYRWSAHPWFGESGKVGGALVVNEDITTQTESGELTRLLVNLAESAAEGVAIVRAHDHSTLYINRSMERLLGYEAGELLDKPLSIALDTSEPAQRQQFENLKRALTERGFWHGEVVNRTKAGKKVWTYTVATAQTHATYGPVWVVHKIDYSELRNANITALRERQRFDSLIEGIDRSANLVFTDTNGIITYVNKHFCELTGFDREELIGQTHRLLNSGAHTRDFFKSLWETILSGEVWTGEICNRKRDGSLFWMESTMIPLFDQDGKVEQFMAVRFDTSAQKAIQQKLTASAKMAALGEMAGGIAHEINNPLTVIAGSAIAIEDLLNSDPVNKPAIQAMTVKIMKYVDRIGRIVRGMKTFARSSDHDQIQAHSIRSIIDDTLDMCVDKFKARGIPITTSGPLDVNLLCRPTEIAQVLVNLLNNSYDSIVESEKPWIRIDLTRQDDRFEIRVTDSGPGIPANVAQNIFQPFFTTKVAGKGTGLGLSISKGIAEQHNGTFYLDTNSPNTSFVLTLPVAP
ncbi:MAG: PAS domain S-box protein [Bdellovibrionales bacterium]|nr:PAS domain S-box protein [Bdellovibrionales bacterium]